MTKYNTVNLKLSNLQLKSFSFQTLNLSSNAIGESNDGTHCPHKFFLTRAEDTKICEAFENVSSANIKFSKSQLS